MKLPKINYIEVASLIVLCAVTFTIPVVYQGAKTRAVERFLEAQGCADIGPPQAGSEATKYFSHAYMCPGQLLVPVQK